MNLKFTMFIFQNIFTALYTAESRHQIQNWSSADNHGQPEATPPPVRPEDTNAHNNRNHLTFTDGGRFTIFTDFF